MKKTLFLLSSMALVTSAQAATIIYDLNKTQNSGNSAISWTVEGTGNTTQTLENFSITFSLSSLPTGDSDPFYRTWSYYAGLNIRYMNSNFVLTNGTTALENGPAVVAKANTQYTMTVLEGKAYLWEGTEVPTIPSTYGIVSTMANTGEYGIKSGTTKLYSNSGTTPVTLHRLTDLTGVSANDYFASVPEPATASLSLLGLAALMMRRRRA